MNKVGNNNELIVANNYVTYDQISKNKWKIIKDVPAIFFAKVGAAVMLNRKRLVKHEFLLDNNSMAYSFDAAWDTYFGKTIFDTIYLPGLVQVGALPSYNANQVEDINVSIPSKDEQSKIGQLFQYLDSLLTLHQRLCSFENNILGGNKNDC